MIFQELNQNGSAKRGGGGRGIKETFLKGEISYSRNYSVHGASWNPTLAKSEGDYIRCG
jgi:hypothetical protein